MTASTVIWKIIHLYIFFLNKQYCIKEWKQTNQTTLDISLLEEIILLKPIVLTPHDPERAESGLRGNISALPMENKDTQILADQTLQSYLL